MTSNSLTFRSATIWVRALVKTSVCIALPCITPRHTIKGVALFDFSWLAQLCLCIHNHEKGCPSFPSGWKAGHYELQQLHVTQSSESSSPLFALRSSAQFHACRQHSIDSCSKPIAAAPARVLASPDCDAYSGAFPLASFPRTLQSHRIALARRVRHPAPCSMSCPAVGRSRYATFCKRRRAKPCLIACITFDGLPRSGSLNSRCTCSGMTT